MRTKIRNRYNQAPHLTEDTNRKVTTSQLDINNVSQEVRPFPADDHKAKINIHARKHNKKNRYNVNDPQNNYHFRKIDKKITGGLKPVSQRANLTLSSDVDQDTKMFGLHERPLPYNVSCPRIYKSRYKKEIKQR